MPSWTCRPALAAGLFDGAVQDAAEAAARPTLNRFLDLGAGPRAALRERLFEILCDEATAPVRALAPRLLHRAADCTLHVPAAIGGYTDFYAGIQHATNVGQLMRPDTPLMPNYKYVPIAYHGRASSVRPSGAPVHRPNGQRKPTDETSAGFRPDAASLDYEMELGIWIGPGNALGEPMPIAAAHAHVAGFCLLNDWSARDIQGWEYQPLGPFLGKNFLTSISPWIITTDALRPFRVPQPPRPEGDPAPLHHLSVRVRPDPWRAGRRPGSAADHQGNPRPRHAAAAPVARQHAAPLLDFRPDGGAPHQQRLQPRRRRPVRLRHHFRARAPPAGAACWS